MVLSYSWNQLVVLLSNWRFFNIRAHFFIKFFGFLTLSRTSVEWVRLNLILYQVNREVNRELRVKKTFIYVKSENKKSKYIYLPVYRRKIRFL